MKTLKILTMIIFAAGLFFSCRREPEPIQYGRDACTHCKMTIMDKRFAAEIVTSKGKIFKFDATECMAGFLKDKPEIAENPQTIFLVSDYNKPGALGNARNSFFLDDSTLRSPMGGNLAAFQTRGSAVAAAKSKNPEIYTWPALLKAR
jgi:copper chaperone NosL